MKRKLAILVASSLALSFTSCGVSEGVAENQTTEAIREGSVSPEEEKQLVQMDAENFDNLMDGVFYVRHSDGVCEPYYMNYGNIEEGEIVSEPRNSRFLWFQEDFDKIPTLYEDDDLIMFSNYTFSEVFNYERLEDLGYTIGLKNFELLDSGRYALLNDENSDSVYPCEETTIITQSNNEQITIDKLGGVKVRSTGEIADDEIKNTEDGAFLSRSGTFKNLIKDRAYKVELYDGTVKKEVVLTANIKVLASMEISGSCDYDYIDGNVIKLNIPEYFNTGYYMLNASGVFRYVKGVKYADRNNIDLTTLDYSVANKIPEEAQYGLVAKTLTEEELYHDDADMTSHFTVVEPGEIKVRVTFALPYEREGDGMPEVYAIITGPDNVNLEMIPNVEEDCLELEFNAGVVGDYTITYYDLDIREPHVEILSE